jgi:hypothetical protein
VEGLTLANVSPDAAGSGRPPMSSFFGAPSRKGRAVVIGEAPSIGSERVASDPSRK